MKLNSYLLDVIQDIAVRFEGAASYAYEVDIDDTSVVIKFSRDMGNLLHSRFVRYVIKVELVAPDDTE